MIYKVTLFQLSLDGVGAAQEEQGTINQDPQDAMDCQLTGDKDDSQQNSQPSAQNYHRKSPVKVGKGNNVYYINCCKFNIIDS